MKRVIVIPGDGIGPEVILPTVEIVREINDQIDFEIEEVGKALFERTGESISDETMKKVSEADAILFGATTTVMDKAYRSPIIRLRKELDLFANVRPVRAIKPRRSKVNMVIVRENTEGLYTQEEQRDLGGVTTFRRVSIRGCKRIVEFAFNWCEEHGRRRLTCVHKANVLRQSDGLFLEIFMEEKTKHPRIEPSDMLVDSAAMRMVMFPGSFDAVVTLNLYGDILSDMAAGLVGGLGLVPSANIGEGRALFEPAHGSAPDIAGSGIASPFASLMSAAMMLEYLGYQDDSLLLTGAVERTLKENPRIIDAEGRCKTLVAVEKVRSAIRRTSP